eukprot:gene13580-biopygen5035
MPISIPTPQLLSSSVPRADNERHGRNGAARVLSASVPLASIVWPASGQRLVCVHVRFPLWADVQRGIRGFRRRSFDSSANAGGTVASPRFPPPTTVRSTTPFDPPKPPWTASLDRKPRWKAVRFRRKHPKSASARPMHLQTLFRVNG